jgi:hypothetical protein
MVHAPEFPSSNFNIVAREKAKDGANVEQKGNATRSTRALNTSFPRRRESMLSNGTS